MDVFATPPADVVADLPGAAKLAGAPRAVRHLEPPDAPWPGCLATGEQGSCFLVDARLLAGWPGWDADSAGHVLAPSDIVRRTDGHDVLLPLCTERLGRFLQRRAGRGIALSAGEAVTVIVSVLRGTSEALARSPFAAGEWWLTDAGKPVFVHGDGADAVMAADVCLAALGEVVPEVAELRMRLGGVEGTARGIAAADLAHPRALVAALPELEAALFARSEPEPLATTDLAPARARAVGTTAQPVDDILAHTRRAHWSPLARFVDSDLREVVAAGWDALRESRRRRARGRADGAGARRRRRRIALVAAAAGVAVTAAGLLWPGDEPVAADSSGVTPRPTTSASPTRTVAPVADPGRSPRPTGAAEGSEVAVRIQAMLAARIACGHDRACRGSFSEDPGRRLPGGAIDDAAQSVTLLDDFGGAAVVRVSSAQVSGSGRSQLVVAVRSDQKWLIRDVRDAADQPK